MRIIWSRRASNCRARRIRCPSSSSSASRNRSSITASKISRSTANSRIRISKRQSRFKTPMSKQTKLTAVVAIDKRGGIGVNNTLPWHLPEDLAHFKRTTSGHPIIKGHKTYESISRPLPNRRKIVVTRDPSWRHDGVETVRSLAEATALAAGGEEAFIIGGGQIFAEAMPLVQKLIVTEIDKTFECDAFFPQIDTRQWKETAREENQTTKKQNDKTIVTYERAYRTHIEH